MADRNEPRASEPNVQKEDINKPGNCKCEDLAKPLTEIMKRLDAISANVTRLNGLEDKLNEVIKSTHTARLEIAHEMSDLKLVLSECRLKESKNETKILHLESQITRQNEWNRRLNNRISILENKSLICRLKIDGKYEEDGENLTEYVSQLAEFLRPGESIKKNITAVYRLGKRNTRLSKAGWEARPRSIAVVFNDIMSRNKFYFARNTLKMSQKYNKIYINDEVNAETRKAREDYRSVAILARAMGEDVKIHDDGLVIGNIKYSLLEPNTLPEPYSLKKAKEIEVNGEILYHSEHTYLSNFYRSPIIDNGISYMTAEHQFQAEKCRMAKDTARLNQVITAVTPQEAMRIAGSIQDTPEWKNQRISIMKEIIDRKFDQNSELAEKLLATGDRVLKEATNDALFGIGASIHSRAIRDKTYNGQNEMGKILMEKRTRLAVEKDAQLVGTKTN